MRIVAVLARMLRLLTFLIAPLFSLFFTIPTTHAQLPAIITDLGPDCNFTTGKLIAACIPLFIGHLIEVIFSLVSIFFILNIIFAGYQFAIGAWSGEKSKGKDRLLWSIIGLIVCASAFLILDVVLTVIAP